MTFNSEDQCSESQYNNSVLVMIYNDANESFKLLRDDINSINTRLTFLIGFNATFASLLPKLPIQTLISIKYLPSQDFYQLYPYAEPFIQIPIIIINWLLLTKPLISIFLGISVVFTIQSVLPSTTPIVILPKKMLEKGKNCSEEDFRIAIIKNRDETIQRLQILISRKALRLKYALITLGGAAFLTVFDILTNANITFN
jgi:hypothetical protein